MPFGSVLLYWAGMALNDWADREVDAVERPERVIPTGRVPAGTALVVAGALGAAGIAATALVGGRRALRISVPLAVLIATYDVRGEGLRGRAARDGLHARPRRAARRRPGLPARPLHRPLPWPSTPSASPCSAAARCTAPRRRPRRPRLAATGTAIGVAAGDGRGRRWSVPVRLAPSSGAPRCTPSPSACRRRARSTSPDAATATRGDRRRHRAGSRCSRRPGSPARGRILPAIAVATAGPLLRRAARVGEPDMSVRLGYGLNGFAGPPAERRLQRRRRRSATRASALTLDQPHLDPFGDLPGQVAHAATLPRRPRPRPRSSRRVRATSSTRGASTSRPWSATRAASAGSTCCAARCGSPTSSGPRRCRAGPAPLPRVRRRATCGAGWSTASGPCSTTPPSSVSPSASSPSRACSSRPWTTCWHCGGGSASPSTCG